MTEAVNFISAAWYNLYEILTTRSVESVIMMFFPFVLIFELPFTTVVILGILKYQLRKKTVAPARTQYPAVSCIVLCYSEGAAAIDSIRTLAYQLYPGKIEIIVLVDGAAQNALTLKEVQSTQPQINALPNRSVKIIPKWQRGGRVSSLNSGLALASGEIVLVADGDTSFDNMVIENTTVHFANPNVVGVAGNLRVRNANASFVTIMQTIEYMLSISLSKTGLSEFNIVNNISGAFGIFRKSFIKHLGGWDSGTAEDLDMTTRIKNYFGRYPNLKIVFEPRSAGYTDVPDTFSGFVNQRLRWDGDLFYIYIRKFWGSFTPRILGWKNFLFYVWMGLFFQLGMPFVIVAYTAATFIILPSLQAASILIIVYLYYLAVTVVNYLLYLATVCPDPYEDSKYFFALPIYPFFTFMMRLWNAIATIFEICTKSHLDSSMAPWWVLKKTKF